MGPSLLPWVWIIYYMFFISLFILSIYRLIKDDIHRVISIFHLVLIPLTMVANFFYALHRSDVNELQFFWNQLLSLDLFAIVLLVVNAYFLVYLGIILKHIVTRTVPDQ